MLSKNKLFIVALIPILFVALIAPVHAQRRGGVQRHAPQMRRSAPRQQVRRAAPRPQVRRSAPRPQVRHSAPRRQVTRSVSRPQVRRQAPQRSYNQSRAPQRPRYNAPKQQRYTSRPQPRRQVTRNQTRQEPANRQMTRRPGRQMPANNKQFTQRPGRQMPGNQQVTRRPGRQLNANQYNVRRPGRQVHANQQFPRPGRQVTSSQPNVRRPGRMTHPATKAPNYTAGPAVTRPNIGTTQGLAVRRPVNVNNNVNVNSNYTYAQPYSQPVVYNNPRPVVYNNYCPPGFNNAFYSPVIYNDYCVRRRFRRFNNCGNIFWSLGFFLSRPYSYYDYARVGYNNPIIYGDDNYYQPAPIVTTEGGPEPDTVTGEGEVAVVPTQPSLNTPEARMLSQVSQYVDDRSAEGRFRISDAAFSNEVWLLELAQAPAVFEIKDGLYSVVAGFEGTLGTSNVPSNVNVEFFVAKTANGYEVRDAWITSANGIARNKLYQSPVYPDVKTWESGKKCPFTGQPMIPIPQNTAPQHG